MNTLAIEILRTQNVPDHAPGNSKENGRAEAEAGGGLDARGGRRSRQRPPPTGSRHRILQAWHLMK